MDGLYSISLLWNGLFRSCKNWFSSWFFKLYLLLFVFLQDQLITHEDLLMIRPSIISIRCVGAGQWQTLTSFLTIKGCFSLPALRIHVQYNRGIITRPSCGPACKYFSFCTHYSAPLPLLLKTNLLLSFFLPLLAGRVMFCGSLGA